MQRVLPVLLLALLVVTASGGAAVTTDTDTSRPTAATPVQQVAPNTTHVLQLDSVQVASLGQADISATDALSVQSTRASTTFSAYVLEARYDAAENESAKQQVLRNATDRTRERVLALETAERQARLAYVSGELSGEDYYTTLGRIDRQAQILESRLDSIDEVASRNSPVVDRLDRLRVALEALEGPLRADAGRALAGMGSTPRTYVAASSNGFVVSTVSGDSYRREAVRWDNRDDIVGGLDIQGAEQRFSTLYPWAWENKPGGFSIDLRGPDVWKLELTHEHGILKGNLDMSTQLIYQESQEKRLLDMPTTTSRSTTSGNTTLAVSDTYPGGPLKIKVTNGTGAPVTAAVSVNGTSIGDTNEDGVVWALSHQGAYVVSAQHEGETLNLTVDASSVPVAGTARPTVDA